MAFDKFNRFLFNQSGVTGALLNKFYDEFYIGGDRSVHHASLSGPSSSEPGSLFFQPCPSKTACFYRAASIVTAPVCLLVMTVELFLEAIYYALQMIADVVMKNPDEAKSDLKCCCGGILAMVIVLTAAIISPFMNGIDLIGGLVADLPAEDSGAELRA